MSDPQEEAGFVISSGNVFADLGLPNADEELAKAKMALALRQRTQALGLTQTAAADLLGTDQGKVSNLMRGKIGGFTLDRLVRFLNALEMDVHISVEPAQNRQRGKTLVTTG